MRSTFLLSLLVASIVATTTTHALPQHQDDGSVRPFEGVPAPDSPPNEVAAPPPEGNADSPYADGQTPPPANEGDSEGNQAGGATSRPATGTTSRPATATSGTSARPSTTSAGGGGGSTSRPATTASSTSSRPATTSSASRPATGPATGVFESRTSSATTRPATTTSSGTARPTTTAGPRANGDSLEGQSDEDKKKAEASKAGSGAPVGADRSRYALVAAVGAGLAVLV